LFLLEESDFLPKAIEKKIRNELTHAMIRDYCMRRKVDLSSSGLAFFSEALAIIYEYKGIENKLKEEVVLEAELAKVDSSRQIPERFPEVLTHSVMNVYLPSFLVYLADRTGSENIAFRMFDYVADNVPMQVGKEKSEEISREVFERLTQYKAISEKAKQTKLVKDIVNPGETNSEIRARQTIGYIHAVISNLELESPDDSSFSTDTAKFQGTMISEKSKHAISRFLFDQFELNLEDEWILWRESILSSIE